MNIWGRGPSFVGWKWLNDWCLPEFFFSCPSGLLSSIQTILTLAIVIGLIYTHLPLASRLLENKRFPSMIIVTIVHEVLIPQAGPLLFYLNFIFRVTTTLFLMYSYESAV
jgi:hypothetical protein